MSLTPPAVVPPCRIIFSGRVQGVGFRYRTKSIARSVGARGTVRNLSDGTVELCLAGPPEAANRCLRELCEALAGNITGVEVCDWNGPVELPDFRIIH